MQRWPADAVSRCPIEQLIPYASNARTHSDAQIAQIAASMKEWGWTTPILADESGMIIAGHGRVLAARQLGLREVPVMVAEGWSEAQKRAYVLADNQLALSADWDLGVLKNELEGLKDCDFDLSLLGFGDLEALMADKTVGLTDPDAVPEEPDVPASQAGDVWLLGRQRLVCGDCTDPAIVGACLRDVKPHLMVTDPPYGVEYDAVKARDATAGSAKGRVLNDDRADWREAWALFPGQVAYVWHAGLRSREVVESLQATGFDMRAQIIWDKTRLIMSRGHYHFQHEPCWYAVRKNKAACWTGDRKQSTVWAIVHRQSETGHSTQKPVECMKRPIENNSSPGQAVYEPFSGSGTTLIAAEITGRHCHAIELNPAYVDVAIKRWQDFTGEEAVLEGHGRSFKEIAAERAGAIPAASRPVRARKRA